MLSKLLPINVKCIHIAPKCYTHVVYTATASPDHTTLSISRSTHLPQYLTSKVAIVKSAKRGTPNSGALIRPSFLISATSAFICLQKGQKRRAPFVRFHDGSESIRIRKETESTCWNGGRIFCKQGRMKFGCVCWENLGNLGN